jgi:hypothetical protein
VYRDPVLWLSVRHRVLQKGAPIRQVVREAGISRKTVRKMLAHPLPKPYGPRGRRPEAERAISLAPKPESQPEEARQAACEWMRAVLQKDIDPDALRRDIGDVPDLAHLLRRLYDGRLSDRNRSMTVLASRRGLEDAVASDFLGIGRRDAAQVHPDVRERRARRTLRAPDEVHPEIRQRARQAGGV